MAGKWVVRMVELRVDYSVVITAAMLDACLAVETDVTTVGHLVEMKVAMRAACWAETMAETTVATKDAW